MSILSISIEVTGFVELMSITIELDLTLSKNSLLFMTFKTASSSDNIVIIICEFSKASFIDLTTFAPSATNPSAFSKVLLKAVSL